MHPLHSSSTAHGWRQGISAEYREPHVKRATIRIVKHWRLPRNFL
jgi:hypothetical protein